MSDPATKPYPRAHLLSELGGALVTGDSAYELAALFHRSSETGRVEVLVPSAGERAGYYLLAAGDADALDAAARTLAAAARWARGPAPDDDDGHAAVLSLAARP